MLRLLADENFNGDILRGLLHRERSLDLVRAQDVGLLGAEDRDVLAWAAANNRILLTHDKATMPDFAFERVASGDTMPGVFVLGRRLSVRESIDELLLLHELSETAEWNDRVIYLPLR